MSDRIFAGLGAACILALGLAGAANLPAWSQTPPTTPATQPTTPAPQTTPTTPTSTTPAEASQSAIQNLAGLWVGTGTIESNGTREKISCRATYFIRDGGKHVEQNLRCASASYKVDAQAKLTVNGSRISGTWEERSFSSNGNISGVVRTGGFLVKIEGQTFTANMSVATAGKDRQNLNIIPTGLAVTRITISFSRSSG
ncbi:MAG: hypothetical protein F9K44_04135 [Hyphomicrobiaceae bacterium]|nr:MAG: hypothetical protein F9K44_04135 [Hyphomicrobiaceae bacterium]